MTLSLPGLKTLRSLLVIYYSCSLTFTEVLRSPGPVPNALRAFVPVGQGPLLSGSRGCGDGDLGGGWGLRGHAGSWRAAEPGCEPRSARVQSPRRATPLRPSWLRQPFSLPLCRRPPDALTSRCFFLCPLWRDPPSLPLLSPCPIVLHRNLLASSHPSAPAT